jgi:hypothetical protein
LQGRLQAARSEAVGVALHCLRDHRVAVGAAPADAFGEGLEMHMEVLVLLETEQQIHRALQQAGEQPGALGKGCRLTEEVGHGGAPAVQRHPITGDGQPLAALQALGQLQHGRRVQFADLDQPQVVGAGLVQ